MQRIVTWLVTLLILGAIGGAYWWMALRGSPAAQAPQSAVPPGIVVEAAPVIRATSVRKLKAIGTLASNQSVLIRPEIAGRLTELHFENGTEVAADDLLAVLDQKVLMAELTDAEAALDLARREYARADQLLERGTGTVARRDEALSALNSGNARVELAKAQLEKTEIHAPFHGTAGIRKVDVGEYLAAGDEIVNLEQITPIKAYFEVPERFLTDLFVGKQVILRSEAYRGSVFHAEVSAVDPLINSRTRSIEVEAIASNEDGRLRPGQFVTVTVRVDERPKAIFVPEQALVPNSESPMVFRVIDGKAVSVPVVPGTRIARHVEILHGLFPGDMVVTAGQQRLADGVPVIAKDPTFVPPSPPDEEIQVIGSP